jgi:signal transduction histidine kinase
MPTEVLLDADHDKIGLAIEHLLLNSLRATPADGIIDIELIDGKDEITLLVEDSGYGIHPDEAERLFKPFQRIKRPDDTGGELGLGLSVVRAIVDIHQGAVRVESSPMSGARVILTFPR